ncbi:MAG TPA: ParA family protein [Candidatus Saccharimonadales bacterium]|nr:ParA family protein [Candidatus Saccharimonadales bacterium]
MRPIFPPVKTGSNGSDRLKVIVSITNQKGGVGKTTTAINLSAAIAEKGLKTLLVDLDPQSNATLSYLDRKQVEKTVYDALTEKDLTFKDIVVRSSILHLDIAPSAISLAKLESRLVGELDGHFRLKDRLQSVIADYDYIVLDTPPTLGLLTVNALVASTHLLIPIQSSYFSLEGTDDLLETVEKIKARPNPDLQILGVVITLHDKRTVLARDIRKQIKEVFGSKVFKTVISKSVRLEESPAYKESIFTFAPESSGALDYYRLSEEVISRV